VGDFGEGAVFAVESLEWDRLGEWDGCHCGWLRSGCL
jgi:hypothetical protein